MVLNDDNDEARRAVEVCFRTKKTLVNPIIDWTDDDVWEFIHKYNIPYCELYDKGKKRLGCIGCPMNTATRKQELDEYPKYKEQYLRCFDKMVQNRKNRGLSKDGRWKTGQDIYDWWVGEEMKDDRQISLLAEEDDP